MIQRGGKGAHHAGAGAAAAAATAAAPRDEQVGGRWRPACMSCWSALPATLCSRKGEDFLNLRVRVWEIWGFSVCNSVLHSSISTLFRNAC